MTLSFKLSVGGLFAALFFAPVAARACPDSYLVGCPCPTGCDLPRCERPCYKIQDNDRGCLYRCKPCDCSLIGARETGVLDWIAGVFASNAVAAESKDEPIQASNEDGDFVFLTPEAARKAEEDAYGVSMRVAASSGSCAVTGVDAAGPAGKAGIKEGDEIISIDGRRCAGMSAELVGKSLRGRSGTLVVLKVKPHSGGAVRKISLNRAPISFSTEISAARKGLSVREVPQKNGECAKHDAGCNFLMKQDDRCLYTCPTQDKR